jgi:SAM-dependent methyltransferase
LSGTFEPGSFRDPDSRVFYSNGRVLRFLTERGLADWERLSSSPLLGELVSEGKLVETSAIEDAAIPAGEGISPPAAVLEHERIPVVSYPYEWSFGMLRRAALLQLELVRRAVEAGLMLKDSSPYNVQWRGTRPVFVDVGSFEALREGEPWAGYRQFCSLFLYPLLLQAYKDVPFQPWLRGSLEGITPAEMRSLMSARDLLRRGVPTHVALHSRLEQRYSSTERDLKRELKRAGFSKELILANVRKLEKLVGKLRWKAANSTWSGYEPTTSYTEADATRKAELVEEVVNAESPRLVWDLGCNEGRHARIAARTADYVVAVDADPLVVDRLFEALAAENDERILPLYMNLVDASAGLGWRGAERLPFESRSEPDLILCLALVHHLSISGNVPLAQVVDWLHSLGATLLIEFPDRDDPMVERLLRRKRETDHPDYRRDWFEHCLAERFEIVRPEVLSSGSRTLYHARPRS